MPDEVLQPTKKKTRSQRFVERILNPIETRVTKDLHEKFLQEGEEIIDYLSETLIPAIDFRWVILTDRRMIFVIRHFLDTEFNDMSFDSMEFEYKKGTLLFDEVTFERFSNIYRAQFYSFYRDHVLRFLGEIEEAIKGSSVEKETQDAIHTLKDLTELWEKGIISKEEFEEKKKKYIDEI